MTWPGTLASGGPPSRPSSTAHSTSIPSTAASTSTLGSCARAASMAGSTSSSTDTRVIPMLEPPRAGLTNTGQPSSAISSRIRLRSATARQSRSRTTTYRPTGRPRADMSSFMYSLSMPAALANTPAPTYRVPVISSRPCRVPSSP